MDSGFPRKVLNLWREKGTMKTLATFQLLKRKLRKRTSKMAREHKHMKYDAVDYTGSITYTNENITNRCILDEETDNSQIEINKDSTHGNRMICTPESNILGLAVVKSISRDQNNQKTNGFDQSIRVSDNPFDVLDNNSFKTIQIKVEEKQHHTSKVPDDLLLSVIKKHKEVKQAPVALRKEGIFQKLTIYSKSALVLQNKRYYKFPFEIQTLNDGSIVFESIRNAFVSALSSAYSNYRRFGESFKVLTKEGLFIFEKDLTCSKSLSKTLHGLDVEFSTVDDYVIVNSNDKGLVYDMIMNLEIPRGRALPFILSEFEFEDGIAYRTKLKKGPMVRNGSTIEHTHYMFGPLYSSDFKFDDNAWIDYDE